MSLKRLRVLLIAEACNPEWTSVPLLGYYWYREISERVDVTLVTQVRNKPAFERCAPTGKEVFIDSEPVAAPLHKLGRLLTLGHPTALGVRHIISWPAYLYFEHLVWKRFRGQVLGGEFDLVHRLTPLSPTVPSPIAAKCPVPFVIGPLNGSLPWPRGTSSIRYNEGEWLTPLRRLHRAMPYWRQTFARAALVIAATSHVRSVLPRHARERCAVLSENGVDVGRFRPSGALPVSRRRPFTVVFVGRLIPLKQPALLLHAVARMGRRKDKIRVVYVGQGPEREQIIAAAERLTLTKQLDLVGSVPHTQLPVYYRASSVLALPSVHESGGAVLLEAMACGLPCVVLDYGGPREYVTQETGVRVPLGSFDDMVAGFANALLRYFDDPRLLDASSQAARRVAETRFSWPAKADQMLRLYTETLHEQQIRRSSRPCLTYRTSSSRTA